MSLDERLKYVAMKARHKNILGPWYKKWWGKIILLIIALVLILLLISSLYIVNKVQEILATQNQALTAQELQDYIKTINGDGTNYSFGTNKPQVTIIEFGDFACPYSRESAPIIKSLAEEYKNKIKIIWRDYLRNEDSIDLALSARCAGEQGKFWEMHDALFANQDSYTTNDSTRPNRLITLAQSLKLDSKKFTDCLNSKTYLDQIKKDYADGNKLEIAGTPTWFVNNYPFSGALSEQKFRELISGLIK